MSTTTTQAADATPRRVHSAGRVLHVLMSVFDISDTDLAVKLGVSRQTIYNRRRGRRAMDIDTARDMAAAIDVDPRLFLGSPAEALGWVLEHRSHLFVWQAA